MVASASERGAHTTTTATSTHSLPAHQSAHRSLTASESTPPLPEHQSLPTSPHHHHHHHSHITQCQRESASAHSTVLAVHVLFFLYLLTYCNYLLTLSDVRTVVSTVASPSYPRVNPVLCCSRLPCTARVPHLHPSITSIQRTHSLTPLLPLPPAIPR